jgi:hypothetical protein
MTVQSLQSFRSIVLLCVYGTGTFSLNVLASTLIFCAIATILKLAFDVTAFPQGMIKDGTMDTWTLLAVSKFSLRWTTG